MVNRSLAEPDVHRNAFALLTVIMAAYLQGRSACVRLEQLRYLEAILRHGSFRREAGELDLTQAALSQQVRRLEEELNVTLLIRRRTGTVPTEAGTSLAPFVRQVLAAESALQQECAALNGLKIGKVRFGCITSLSQTILPPVVRQYGKDYPDVEFQVWEAGSLAITEQVRVGELDLGVVARLADEPFDDRELIATDLLRPRRFQVCAPLGHPLLDQARVTLADLSTYPLVVLRRSYLLHEVLRLAAPPSGLNVVYYSDNVETVRRLVAEGVGIALLGGLATLDDTAHAAKLGLREVVGPSSRDVITLVRRSVGQPAPAVRELIRYLRDACRRWEAA